MLRSSIGLRRCDGDEDAIAFLPPLLDVDAHALDRLVERGFDHVGLRIGREARRHAHIVGVDGGVLMRHEPEGRTR